MNKGVHFLATVVYFVSLYQLTISLGLAGIGFTYLILYLVWAGTMLPLITRLMRGVMSNA